MNELTGTPRGASNRVGKEEPLHVVIAFDDVPAYHRALRLLVRVIGEEYDLRPLPWKFDTLASSDWRPHACNDVSRAEIIIVSTSVAGELPYGVRIWVEACRQLKRRSTALLVALLGLPDDEQYAHESTLSFLRNAAAEAGLAFLTPSQVNVDPDDSHTVHAAA